MNTNAEYVSEFVEELKTAKYWFKNDGKPLPEWKFYETRSAAYDAAKDAAYKAAYDAAYDAAWDAAWGAARYAARGAAWDAARYAAWDAAWYVARYAARDAALFAGLLMVMDLDIPFKHFEHANKRMQVWRKGYGLLCDVKGVLYVYKML